MRERVREVSTRVNVCPSHTENIMTCMHVCRFHFSVICCCLLEGSAFFTASFGWGKGCTAWQAHDTRKSLPRALLSLGSLLFCVRFRRRVHAHSPCTCGYSKQRLNSYDVDLSSSYMYQFFATQPPALDLTVLSHACTNPSRSLAAVANLWFTPRCN